MPARKKKQARIQIRTQLAARDLRITDLAKRLGHDVAVISKAINHGRYPRVLRKIKEVLGV